LALGVLCAAAVWGSIGAKQERPAPATPPAPERQRKFVSEGTGGKTLEIAAGPGSIIGKDELILKEYVDIKYGDTRLQADFVRYVPSTKDVTALGNVILDQGTSRLTAEKLTYNLDAETGVYYNARGYAEPSYYFEAQRVEKISKDEMVLYDATFTACTQPVPYWSFKVGHGLIRQDDYAYLHNLRFKVGHVVVFYTPYLVWPVKSDRASGLLFPEFGFSRRSGTVISNALYWAIRRNMDATFYLDYMSLAGYGNGLEYRYVPSENGRGYLTGYFIRDQIAKQQHLPGVPIDRWVINFGHNQAFGDGWHLVANANFISDFNYYRDFERDLRLSTNPQAVSNLFVTKTWGFSTLNLTGERREQLLNEEETITRWIEPKIELRGRRQRLGDSPFFLTLDSSADYFNKGTPNAQYGRFDLFPVFSSQLSPVPWLDVNASLGYRDTYYTKSQSADIIDEAFNRHLYQGGLTVIGPKLSRVFDRPDSSFSPQYKSTIEPQIQYSYQSRVTDPDRVVPFDEIDVINANSDQVTYSLVTRLFAKRPVGGTEELGALFGPANASFVSGGHYDPYAKLREALRKKQEEQKKAGEEGGQPPAATGEEKKRLSTVEIATLEFSQDYSFLGPLSVSTALGSLTEPLQSNFGPIRGTLRVNPSIHTSLDVRSSYDILFREIRDASLSANLRSIKRGFLDLTWSMSRDLEGRALLARGLAFSPPFDQNQIGLQGETNFLDRRFLVGMQTNYELGSVAPGEPRLRDQRYRFGYNTQCCGFQLEVLNRNFVGSSNREFRFLINLKGVGNVVDFQSGSAGALPGTYPGIVP